MVRKTAAILLLSMFFALVCQSPPLTAQEVKQASDVKKLEPKKTQPIQSQTGKPAARKKETEMPEMMKKQSRKYTAGEKLGRGLLNIVSFPVEFVRQFHIGASKDTSIGRIGGLLAGFGCAFLRLGAGFVDLITFPFDFPDPNKAPLVEPEFIWSDL